jgi:hypothetical protein
MRLLLLLAVMQGAAPTVGDTVRIERVLGDVGGAVVRPQPWTLGDLGEQLGPAEVVQGARGAVVRYALVLWYPGEQTISMPGPVLVRRDGSSDTLAASSYRVRVLSVLPAGEPRSKLPPKPARAPVPIVSVSLLPLGILVGVAALGLGATALLWRRRGRAPERPAKVESFPPPDRLARWAAAGEYRAALEGWSWRLARRLGLSRDLEEMAELQRVLEAITDQLYLPGDSARLAGLCERAAALDAAA